MLVHYMKYFFLSLAVLSCSAFAQTLPTFKDSDQPVAPDYSKEAYWSALPFRTDKADALPYGETWMEDSLKKVDVFYIYPTLYGKGKTWCADVNDKHLNKRLDRLPVKFQASVFNKVGRVYAPRYRQGIIACFSDTTGNGEAALAFAYQDVKTAFEYYLKNYNHGRPIIIASHSQGTRHSRQLLKEFFDTPAMKQKLVCAYSIGYGIFPKEYQLLKPCADSMQTQCYVTWSSFKEGYTPKSDSKLVGEVCVNPITWTLDTMPATTMRHTASATPPLAMSFITAACARAMSSCARWCADSASGASGLNQKPSPWLP